MGKGFKHGAGGFVKEDALLNFTVKAYPSDVELNTALPPENTIGVVTNNPITNWTFSNTQPAEAEEGAVWFNVGKTSRNAFDALRQKTLMVYPLTAEQYVSGAWSRKTVKIYQNDEWHDWLTWLYKNGDGCTDVSGGWTKCLSSAGTITLNADRMTFKYSDTGGSGCAIRTNQIDLTDISTVEADLANVAITNDGNGCLGIYSELPNTYGILNTGHTVRHWFNQNTLTRATVDVSHLTGKYYIAIMARATSGSVTSKVNFDVTEVRMY